MTPVHSESGRKKGVTIVLNGSALMTQEPSNEDVILFSRMNKLREEWLQSMKYEK